MSRIDCHQEGSSPVICRIVNHFWPSWRNVVCYARWSLCRLCIVQTICMRGVTTLWRWSPTLEQPIWANSSQFVNTQLALGTLHVCPLYSAAAVSCTHRWSRATAECANRSCCGQHWRAKLERQNAANIQSAALFRANIPVPLSPHLLCFELSFRTFH